MCQQVGHLGRECSLQLRGQLVEVERTQNKNNATIIIVHPTQGIRMLPRLIRLLHTMSKKSEHQSEMLSPKPIKKC